ncbi:ABC transporter ATP-binding protein [Vallitalea okinawensis]|uniref:ABC transporter ATP-binding protein n=1 Tax=Vallitalea okinawensis TaxID=2078660 RepID=UPI000CFB5FD3|nr:ABC transporter ATP-binding protein [Vallitalea okinawensis]
MIRVFKYALKYWYIYLLAILFLVTATFLDMFNPLITQRIVDEVIRGEQYGLFKDLVLLLVGIILARIILGYLREILFDYVGVTVTFDLRKDLFKHLQSLSFSYFDGMNTGEIMSRIKEDADNIFRTFSFGAMLIIDQSLYFIMASTFMLILNWQLALACLAIVPFIGMLAMKFEKKIGEVYGKISDETAQLNTIAQENISGVRLVKAFARERYEINKFLSHNKTYYKLNNEHANTIAYYFPKMEFLTNMLIILVTLIGGIVVVGGDISIGVLIAFSGYINMIIWPMRMLGWLAGMVAECRASMKKLDKIFNATSEIIEKEDAISLEECTGEVKFENVSFTYGEENYVLKNINIYAKPGETIAIMGATGCGKTSIINLLTRYYDATEGKITMDGINIKDATLDSLRKQVSVVMQDTFLFSETIEENIRFGNSEISNEDLIAAAKKADVHSFVDKMNDKYETVIGERGIGLSGGQKQRISIARALAAKPKVVIFDDATSALDMETEGSIQDAIRGEKDVTKFIIAHRISAVKDADEIIVIDDGEIVERGTHFGLLNKKGRYHEIYQQQYEGLID